jgi:hypothetical protein
MIVIILVVTGVININSTSPDPESSKSPEPPQSQDPPEQTDPPKPPQPPESPEPPEPSEPPTTNPPEPPTTTDPPQSPQFSIVGTWKSSGGDRIIFRDGSTGMLEFKFGPSSMSESFTYSFDGSSEDGVYYPIDLHGSTIMGLFQLLYGAVGLDGYYQVKVETPDSIVLQYVYKNVRGTGYENCDLPLTRVDNELLAFA